MANIAYSVNGVPIRLTAERRTHIVEKVERISLKSSPAVCTKRIHIASIRREIRLWTESNTVGTLFADSY